MQKFPMTPGGHARMKKALDHLKRVERLQIADVIETARELGDLKENAEYHAAKERQGHIEARIREFEAKLALSQVIDPERLSGSRVSFGATVTLLDLDADEEITYSIVGEDESDFRHGLLSLKSPIARAILGKEEGDEVEVDLGESARNFEIIEVEFKKIAIPDKRIV